MQPETKTHGAVIVRVERETNSLIRRRWPGSVSGESKKEKNQNLINRAQRRNRRNIESESSNAGKSPPNIEISLQSYDDPGRSNDSLLYSYDQQLIIVS